MLKFDKTALAWAAKKLMGLKDKHGFPQDDAPFQAHAAALLRIAHPRLVKARIDHAIRTGNRYESYQPTAEDQAATGEELQNTTIGPVMSGEDLKLIYVPGAPQFNPVDYLIEKAVDTFEFYPQPIRLRGLIKFPPADGEYYGTDDIDPDKDNG